MTDRRAAEVSAGTTSVWRALLQLPGYCQLLIVGVAVNRMASFVQIFVVLYLTADRHWSVAAAGLVLTMFGAGSVVGVSAGGLVAERLGYRNTIVVSMLGAGTSVAALAAVTNHAAVGLLCGMAGVATQLFRPAAMTLLADAVASEQLLLVTAGYRLGLNAGALVTPLLGAALATHGYLLVFAVDAGSSVAFGVLALFTVPDGRVVPERYGVGATDLPPPVQMRPLRDPRLLWLVAGMVLTATIEIQYVATLPLRVVSQGLPTYFYALLITMNSLLVVALEPPLTGLLRNWPVARSLPLGVLLIGLGIGAFGLPGRAVALIVATLVWTLGEMIGAPPAASFPAAIAPSGLRPRYISLSSGAQSIGYAIGPSVGSLLYSTDQRLLWICCAVGGCAAAGCCSASGRRTAAMARAG